MRATRFPHASFAVICVLALSGCGKSSTAPPPSGGTAADPVSAFTAIPGDGQVTLRWRNPAVGDFVATVVRRKEGAVPTSINDGVGIYQGTDTSHVDSDVTNGVSYGYAAWATMLSGATSDPVSATARPLPPPPGPPTSLSVTVKIHALTLSWTNPTAPGFQKVRVKRKTTGYPTGPNDGLTVYEDTGSSFTDGSLSAGQSYYYAAFALDTFGQASSGAKASGVPEWEYLNITIPAWSATTLFPTHRSGDREFAGHGPRVRVHVYYTVTLPNVNAYVYFDAQEWESGAPAGDGTRAYSTFSQGVKATIPAGFSFYEWLSDADQEFVYVDTDHAHDIFTFSSASPFSRLEIVGDTDGNDVGNTTSDDTQLWRIDANARTFRVRR